MNPNEQKVKEQLEKEGWAVCHNGAPDFICFKFIGEPGPLKPILEVKAVEVKGPNDDLFPAQEQYAEFLTFSNIRWQLIRVKADGNIEIEKDNIKTVRKQLFEKQIKLNEEIGEQKTDHEYNLGRYITALSRLKDDFFTMQQRLNEMLKAINNNLQELKEERDQLR